MVINHLLQRKVKLLKKQTNKQKNPTFFPSKYPNRFFTF